MDSFPQAQEQVRGQLAPTPVDQKVSLDQLFESQVKWSEIDSHSVMSESL